MQVNYVLGSCEDEFMLLKENVGYCSADTIDSSDGSEVRLHTHMYRYLYVYKLLLKVMKTNSFR